MAAWTHFQREHREIIQEPVKCELQLYHKDADIILDRVLEALGILLGKQLTALRPVEDSEIIPFYKKSIFTDRLFSIFSIFNASFTESIIFPENIKPVQKNNGRFPGHYRVSRYGNL